VFTPRVYKQMFDRGEEGRKSIGSYLTPFFYVSMAVAFAISIYSEEVIIILTPKSYHGAIDVVTILSMFYGIMFFGKQPQLIFKKKTYIISLLTFSNIGINVGIGVLFIMKWGVIGAAWGTFLAGCVNVTVSFFISQHFYRIEWEYKKIFLILGLFACAAVSTVTMRHYGMDYNIRLMLKAVYSVIFVIVGVKMNIINKENFLLLKGVFSKKSIRGK